MRLVPRAVAQYSFVFWILTSVVPVLADDNHWTGSANNGLWIDSLNWSLGHIPTPSDDVYIDGAGDFTVTLNTNAQVGLLQLGGGLGSQTLLVTNSNLQFSHGTVVTNAVLRFSDNAGVGGDNFTNTGTILSARGTNTLLIPGIFVNSGAFQADSNAVLVLVLGLSGGFGLLDDGTSFNGSGTIGLQGSANCRGNMFVNGSFTFADTGTIIGTNTWHGPGTLNWAGGQFRDGGVTLASNLNVNAFGPYEQMTQVKITNQTTIHWFSGGVIGRDFTDSIFENRALIILHTNCVMYSITFENPGTIQVLDGTKTLDVDSGVFNNAGVFQVETNNTLIIDGTSRVTFKNGTVFDGSGTAELSSRLVAEAQGNMMVNGIVKFSGQLTGTNTWHGPGTFNWTGGTMTNGHFTLSSDLRVNAPFLQLGDGAHLTNYTSLEVQTFQLVDGYASVCSIDNRGTLVLKTNCTFSGGDLNNYGTLVISGGDLNMWSLNNFGTLTVAEGVTTFYMIFQKFSSYGTLELRGGSLVFDGAPFFAYPIYQPILGNCQFVLAGVYPGGNSPQIQFQHFPTVAFDGTITVTLTNNIPITNGSTFTLVTTDIDFNSFPSNSDIHLPVLTNHLAWRVLAGPSFTIRAVSPVAVTNLAQLTNGVFQFTISGGAGSRCVVETSTNLADWSGIQTNSPYSGNFNLVDMGATNFPRRFYRFHIDD